jgi:hypothetical protein
VFMTAVGRKTALVSPIRKDVGQKNLTHMQECNELVLASNLIHSQSNISICGHQLTNVIP